MVSFLSYVSRILLALILLRRDNVFGAFQSSERNPRSKYQTSQILPSFHKNQVVEICLERRISRSTTSLAEKPNTDINDDIDAITAEAEQAIQAAQASIDASNRNNVPNEYVAKTAPPRTNPSALGSPPNPEPPQKVPVDSRIQSEAVAAAIGSLPIGAILGVYSGQKFPELTLAVDEALLPVSFALITSIATYSVSAQEDSPLGVFTRTLFGKPTKALGDLFVNSLKKSISKTVKSITDIPRNIVDGTKRKVKQTADKIKALPGDLSSAAKRKVEETKSDVNKKAEATKLAALRKIEKTKNDIIQFPKLVSEAALDAVEEFKEDVKATPAKVASKAKKVVEQTIDKSEKLIAQTVEEIAGEIKATPSRVAFAAKDAVEKTLDNTEKLIAKTVDDTTTKIYQAVEEVVSLPSKTVDELTSLIEQSSSKNDPNTIKLEIPKPPKLPPPPPIQDLLKTDVVVDKPKESEVKVSSSPSIPVRLPDFDSEAILKKLEAISNSATIRIPKPNPTQRLTVADGKEKARLMEEVSRVAEQERKKKEVEENTKKAKELEATGSIQEQRRKVDEMERQKAAEAQVRKFKEAEEQEKKILEEAKAKENEAKEKERKDLAEAQRRKQQELLKQQKAEAEEKAKAAGAALLAAATKQREMQLAQQQKEFQRKKVTEEKARIAAEKEKQREQELARQAVERKKRQDEINAKREEEARKKKLEIEQARRAAEQKKLQDEINRKREEEMTKKKLELENKKKELEIRQKALAKKKKDDLEARLSAAASQKSAGPLRPSLRVSPAPNKTAPRGVPTIVRWSKRSDNGITGRIYASSSFKEGERIETSPIVSGVIQNGNVVKTSSGTQYFLSDTVPARSKGESPFQTLTSALPGATISLTKQAKDEIAKNTLNAVREAKPRPTFSIFRPTSLDTSASTKNVAATTVATKKVAPRGVPTLKRWKKNRDGSATGFIYNSSNFADGEKVTTSAVAQGSFNSGEVVRTGSGSRYFLE